MEYSWAIRTLVIIIIITIIMVAIFINSSHLYIYNCLLACAGGHTPQVWRVVKDSAVGRGLPNICVCVWAGVLWEKEMMDYGKQVEWFNTPITLTDAIQTSSSKRECIYDFQLIFFFSFLFLLPLLWLLFQITMGTFFRLSVNLHFIFVSQFVKQCNTLVPAS